jgi:hypothetical protein
MRQSKIRIEREQGAADSTCIGTDGAGKDFGTPHAFPTVVFERGHDLGQQLAQQSAIKCMRAGCNPATW